MATFCFPVDAGIVEAAANFCSALRKVSPRARVVVMSMLAAQEASPSHLGRAAWLAEEVMAASGAQLCVLRIAALFYENLLVLHGDSIRAEGVMRNCFGDAKIPWIAGEDAAELMVSALIHPERFGGQVVFYPPGAEVLSHAQIAETLSVELGREVRFESVSMDHWREELLGLREQGHAALNKDMARHISVLGAAIASRGGSQTSISPGALAAMTGRDPVSFRDFARRFRGQLEA
jgi:uncharacterized protein YbjT (DUF2867 family)